MRQSTPGRRELKTLLMHHDSPLRSDHSGPGLYAYEENIDVLNREARLG